MTGPLHAVRGLLYPPVCPVCLQGASSAGHGPCAACADALHPLEAPWCTGCGGSLDTPLDLCRDCLQRPRHWRHATSVYAFGGLLREVIHRFKYQGHLGFTHFLAAAAVSQWQHRHPGPPPELVVPVPLHWFREWRRGYNQTELLAAAFCQATGLPLVRALYRRHYTRAQASLNLAERQRNLRRAFAPRLDVDLAAKRVLLIDDVLTTGATLEACTHQLLAAGAQAVDVITIARG